jgi:hypothetical protein
MPTAVPRAFDVLTAEAELGEHVGALVLVADYLQGAVMKLLPLLAIGLSLSLAGCGRDPGPKGDPGEAAKQ